VSWLALAWVVVLVLLLAGFAAKKDDE